MAGEIDALVVVESDLSAQRPLDSIGMLRESTFTDFTVSGCETLSSGENHNDVSCRPIVSTPTDMSKISEVENCFQRCSSHSCMGALESPSLDKSIGNCILENGRRYDKSVGSPLEEGALEEGSDVTTEIKDETLDQKLGIEGDAYNLKEDSSEIPRNSLESCWPGKVTENNSSQQLDVSQPTGKDVFGGVSPSSAAEPYEQKDNEGKDIAGNRRPPGLPINDPSFYPSSSQAHKSSHKAQPKRASRKSKNKAKLPPDLHIFMAERKRRTCFSKPARSSNWGLLGNIEKFFVHTNGLGINEIHKYEPSKRKLGQEGRKRNKSRASGSSQGSREKKTASSGVIRLKVKLGNEVCKSIMVSDVFYTSAFTGVSDETKSLAGTNSKVPSFANGIEDKMGVDVIDKRFQCFDNKLGETKIQSDTSIADLHLADKNLEDDGDVVGDFLGLPSHIEVEGPEAVIEKRYTDPGTSPDSEVINLIPDSQANTPENLSDTGLPSKVFAPAVPREAFQAENELCPGLGACHNLIASQCSSHLLPSKKSKKSRLPKKSCEASKGRSKVSDKAGNKRENGHRQRVKEHKSVNQKKVKEKNDCGDNNCKLEEDDIKTGSCILDDASKIDSDLNIAALEAPNLDMASSYIAEQHIPDDAWVRCDDCHKWRRIPVALVDSIGQTNCQWICKDNTDKAFADCSIPQEKSNAEINAELGIPDADEDTCDVPPKSKLEYKRPGLIANEHEFTLISSNQFLHRSRKKQTIDEIMVCHCKLPLDGGLGCGDECLNRLLNIECVQGTCPCGDLCSNQQFQKRNYVKMKWERCGKKGFGLRSEEDISREHFLIEYVGEVLDMHAYEARQREYALNSHKHFYFMTLNGSEVIDACAKGNLGRFINHSCDPNCRTEKWVVHGEICIGLFALRDIKKGEEVTFDYNYVRVFGAAAKKCYCGSSNCRGYIGGDPTSTEVVDQVDSDEEFLEPVMLEDGKTGYTFKNRKSRSSSLNDESRAAENISKDKIEVDHPEVSEVKLEDVSEIQDAPDQSTSAVSLLNVSLESDDLKANLPSSCPSVEISETSNDIINDSVSANHEIPMEENQRCETSPSDGNDAKLKSKSSTVEGKRVFVKSRFLIKTSRESPSSKKGKVASNHLNATRLPMLANKSQMQSIKPKKFMHGTSNGRLETVEEKLNELLDVDGGISKRKDAAKGYLKFLVHTAASGASGNGEAIQSNRDLSMILDALLKTKSRIVLVDIINKNGLRMLHNMIKQYRKDFKKTPILRKLLKGLEYLAVREILTQEHISGGPPCPGMESFRDSMLSLTEHDDKQVHQIARNFRDRWIPRHGRRHGNMDRDDRRMDFHKGSATSRTQNHSRDVALTPTENIDCSMQPKPTTTSMESGTKRRKRKSRWDQPAPGAQLSECKDLEKGKTESYCPHCAHNYGKTSSNIQADVPPGFSPVRVSSITNLPEQNDELKFPDGMVTGYQQKKFDSRNSVSYGIPMPIMDQFGAPLDETKEKIWAVAPGLPFHPFPPLPPFAPRKNETRNSPSAVINETTENEQNNPSTTGSNLPDTETPVKDDLQSFKRARVSPDLGTSYFRQQKWNKVTYEQQRNPFCGVNNAGNCLN